MMTIKFGQSFVLLIFVLDNGVYGLYPQCRLGMSNCIKMRFNHDYERINQGRN